AQLDRFLFKLLAGSPSRADLSEILARTTTAADVSPQPVLEAGAILAHQKLIRRVAIAPHVQDYAVRMVLASHPASAGRGSLSTPRVNKSVRRAAPPRAAQALVLAGKCRALLAGRAVVSTEDPRALAAPALRPRLIMNFESHAEGVTADA